MGCRGFAHARMSGTDLLLTSFVCYDWELYQEVRNRESFSMETATFTGRVRKPLYKKINPIWWVMNDDDPMPPDWYHGSDTVSPIYTGPMWPEWRRFLAWHVIRNPLHNFFHYVLGVGDRNFKVIGTGSTTDKIDIGELGWCWCIIQHGPEIFIPRLYVSFTGKHLSWHVGWMWDGPFGCRLIVR